MEMLRTATGFLGPSLLADVTLVVEILFYIVLSGGVIAQLQGNYKLHDMLQGPVVILNLVFIFVVMVPTFRSIVGQSPARLVEVPTLVTMTHAILGTVAQLLAIYCFLAGFKILPRRIGVLRYWMWATYTVWTATVVFGISVYILFYTDFAATAAPPAVTGATPADGDASQEVISEDLVSEHTEPVATEPQTAPPAATATATRVVLAASPDTPATEPAPDLVDEHAEESVAPTAALTATGTPAGSGVMVDDDTSMDDMIDEHAELVVELPEPQVTGPAAAAAWQQLSTTNAGPGPRYEHAMQANPATNRLYLFGGRDGAQIYNDVWALDLETQTWQQLAAGASPAPSPRYSTVMIVDEAGESLYIATGHASGGQNFNDVWRLDLATERWEELSPGAGPPPEARYGGPGGNFGDDLVLTHGFGATRYDDTWRFDTASGQWQNITPAEPLPLRRCLFAAAPAGGRLVIHGGCAAPFGDCFLDDAWVLDLDGRSWRAVQAETRPVGRQYQSLAAVPGADGAANGLVLFGGQDASRAPRSDLWLLDLTTDSWQPIDAPAGPAARYQHAAVWLPGQGMLVYGGRNDGPLADLWLLRLEPQAAAPQPTATPLPPTVTPTPTPAPTLTPTPQLLEPEPTGDLRSEHEGG